MKEEAYLVNDWKVKDLFDKKFWVSILAETTNDASPFDVIANIIKDTQSEERLEKLNESLSYWDDIPVKLRAALFDNDTTIFSIWLSDLEDKKLNRFSALVRNDEGNVNAMDILREFIIRSDSWKKLFKQKRQAYHDFLEHQNKSNPVEFFQLLDQFLTKVKNENTVTLASSSGEYIMLGGSNAKKVEKTYTMLKKSYKLLYTLQLTLRKRVLPIYVFQVKKIIA